MLPLEYLSPPSSSLRFLFCTCLVAVSVLALRIALPLPMVFLALELWPFKLILNSFKSFLLCIGSVVSDGFVRFRGPALCSLSLESRAARGGFSCTHSSHICQYTYFILPCPGYCLLFGVPGILWMREHNPSHMVRFEMMSHPHIFKRRLNDSLKSRFSIIETNRMNRTFLSGRHLKQGGGLASSIKTLKDLRDAAGSPPRPVAAAVPRLGMFTGGAVTWCTIML